MKNLFYCLSISVIAMCSLQSCNKKEVSHGVSTSFQIGGQQREILKSYGDLTNEKTLNQTDFIAAERGRVQQEEEQKGNEVTSFKIERVWLSSFKIVDYSHVDIDENSDDLDTYINSFELLITDANLVGGPKSLGTGNMLGNINVEPENFYDYTLLYPDFKLKLKTSFNSDPGVRSVLLETNIGMSYEYFTKPDKN